MSVQEIFKVLNVVNTPGIELSVFKSNSNTPEWLTLSGAAVDTVHYCFNI